MEIDFAFTSPVQLGSVGRSAEQGLAAATSYEERKLEDAKSTKRQVAEAAFAARQELERELDKARRAAVDKEREFAIRKDTLELEAGRLKSRALALKGREDGLEREESQVKFK